MQNLNFYFWAIVIVSIFAIFKFLRYRKENTFWKLKLIITAFMWGVLWAPITLTWGYANFSKSSGHALAIGKAGFSVYLSVTTFPKRIITCGMRKANERLARITPKFGRRMASKALKTVKPMVGLTHEIGHDVGLIPTKPKIGLGQKVWRGALGVAWGVLTSPVSWIKNLK